MPIGHDGDVSVPLSKDIYPRFQCILSQSISRNTTYRPGKLPSLFLVQKPEYKMALHQRPLQRPLVRQIIWKRYIVNKTDLQTFLERQFPDMSNFDINVWNLPSGGCPQKFCHSRFCLSIESRTSKS